MWALRVVSKKDSGLEWLEWPLLLVAVVFRAEDKIERQAQRESVDEIKGTVLFSLFNRSSVKLLVELFQVELTLTQVVSRNDILENHAILYATFSDILIWEDHPY